MNYQDWMREAPDDPPMMTDAEWQVYQRELQPSSDECLQCGGPLTTPADNPLVLSPYCEPCARAWSEREHAETDAHYYATLAMPPYADLPEDC